MPSLPPAAFLYLLLPLSHSFLDLFFLKKFIAQIVIEWLQNTSSQNHDEY